jgi:hypothetical protein
MLTDRRMAQTFTLSQEERILLGGKKEKWTSCY